MKSYEVIREAVEEPGVKAVAARLKVSAALVYKWCEPSEDLPGIDPSGTRNPLDRVAEMYNITRDVKLIRFLCNHAGGFFVPDPVVEPSKTIDHQIYGHTRALFRDFSELLEAVTESVEDDSNVDEEEADAIRQKWEDLKSNVELFVVMCEKGHFHVKNREKLLKAGKEKKQA